MKKQVIKGQLAILLLVLVIWLGWSWCLYHSTIWFAGSETAWQANLGMFGLASPWLLMVVEIGVGLKQHQNWLLMAGSLVGLVYWLCSYQRTSQLMVMLVVPLALIMCWVQTQVIVAQWLPTASLKAPRRWGLGLIVSLLLIGGLMRLSPTATVRSYLAGYSDPLTAMTTHLTFDQHPDGLTNRTRNFDVTTKAPQVITLRVLETQGVKGIELTLHQRGLGFYVTEYPWWVA
ncbi:hypothetical protein [Lactiplantibacillus daowaiensis]|uniref:Uncharacterized protein n=1 Tax=Lactiplantibacillus daowaiensis TaxID=2559918 RepID=A0ABW1S1U7_9LACO|nr:hypothetical protein [Lactiplantibacillus daowaiensis]